MIITKEIVRYAAERYINTDESIGEIAKQLGISKTALVKHFEGMYDTTRLDPKRQAILDKVKVEKWTKGKSTSGNLGHKKLSEEETIKLAKNMVEQKTTLRGLESDVSTSTLYNSFKKKTLGEDLYDEVSNQYDENKKRK